MKKIDTFSANSLKILDKNKQDFINKYIYNLDIYKKDNRAVLGQKFHNLIYYYISNFDISKILYELNEKEIETWKKIENYLKDKKNNFIKLEYPFLIKEKSNNDFYYLTGRFDGIYKDNENYIIYDWKTLNLPSDVDNDIQSIVYLFCASKIFKTNNIKIKYFSLEKNEEQESIFKEEKFYKEKIESIISKLN